MPMPLMLLLVMCVVPSLVLAANAQTWKGVADIGYEETITQRWSTSGHPASPFPAIQNINNIRGLAAVDGNTALGMDSAGLLVGLHPSYEPPAVWSLPLAPVVQREISAGPGACITTITTISK